MCVCIRLQQGRRGWLTGSERSEVLCWTKGTKHVRSSFRFVKLWLPRYFWRPTLVMHFSICPFLINQLADNLPSQCSTVPWHCNPSIQSSRTQFYWQRAKTQDMDKVCSFSLGSLNFQCMHSKLFNTRSLKSPSIVRCPLPLLDSTHVGNVDICYSGQWTSSLCGEIHTLSVLVGSWGSQWWLNVVKSVSHGR